QRRSRNCFAPDETQTRAVSAFRAGRRCSAVIATGTESLVHWVRPLETLRRSFHRNAVPISAATLASLFAKHAQRRRADRRSGYFSKHYRGRFLPIRNAKTADTERR